MKAPWIKVLCLCTLCLLLSSCQKLTLSEEEEAFSGEGLTYAFQLPTGWLVDEKPAQTFTPEAVFGAEDTQNQAVMFVRVHPKKEGQPLATFTKELLADYYTMEGVSGDSFEVGKEEALHYRLFSSYLFTGEQDAKAVWLDVYLVPVEGTIVEFQYYSSKDNRSEDRQALFEASAASVRATGTAKAAEKTTTERKAVNEDVTLQVTTYRTEAQDEDKRRLILRYLCTNNGSETLVPATVWTKLTTVTANGVPLKTVDLTNDPQEQTELTYLVQAGEKELASGQSIESAALYVLEKETTTITLFFDEDAFPQMKPLQLTIK